MGGNGYTEELPLARMAREMPVNSIWEGSGNIMCLDVLRAFGKSAATREAVLQELDRRARPASQFRRGVRALRGAGSAPATPTEAQARRFAQLFVTLMQASVLLTAAAGPAARAVAEGFCATRLDPESGWGAVFGAGGAALDAAAILGRAWQE